MPKRSMFALGVVTTTKLAEAAALRAAAARMDLSCIVIEFVVSSSESCCGCNCSRGSSRKV